MWGFKVNSFLNWVNKIIIYFIVHPISIENIEHSYWCLNNVQGFWVLENNFRLHSDEWGGP